MSIELFKTTLKRDDAQGGWTLVVETHFNTTYVNWPSNDKTENLQAFVARVINDVVGGLPSDMQKFIKMWDMGT